MVRSSSIQTGRTVSSSSNEKTRNQDIFIWIVLIILAISTALLIYLSTFRSLAFDQDYYEEKFQEFNIHDRFNSTIDLSHENALLLSYLEKSEGPINSTFFNERETTHLIEVRDLYKLIFRVIDISVIISIISLLAFMYLVQLCIGHLSLKNQNEQIRIILSRLLFSIGIAVFAFFIFFLVMVLTFDSAFITFHEVFFKTDTWMLDPATDNLIRMFPQQFFFDIFSKIIIQSLIFGFVLLAIGGVIRYWCVGPIHLRPKK